tara:strand:- start:229 stop:795 length:567 start_codon:yes stop_codon:yes gene_type:complete
MDKFTSAIFLYQAKAPKDWCKNLRQYMDIVCKEKASIIVNGQTKLDTENRNVLRAGLNYNVAQDKLYIDFIFNLLNSCLREYIQTFCHINEQLKYEGINLLKYKEGHFYKRHTDQCTSENRAISVIMNLNEDYEGGEVVFYEPTSKKPSTGCALKTGDILFFPSNYLYPHSVQPIKKGTRYSVVVWLG